MRSRWTRTCTGSRNVSDLVPPNVSAERADRLLHELVPDGLRTPLHVALIRLGREICKAPTPSVSGVPAQGHLSDRPALPVVALGIAVRRMALCMGRMRSDLRPME